MSIGKSSKQNDWDRFSNFKQRGERLLLLLARFGKEGTPTAIPKLSQETLAEMIDTTRSRVSFFMNRFRESGLVAYYENGIQVHSSLLNVILHDRRKLGQEFLWRMISWT
jgi:CRP/FNR family transcriptional regulator, cyclic AMP receptor protein